MRKAIEQTTTPGSTGGAVGYLFRIVIPGLSAKEIYRDVFSAARFSEGLQSQTGQDMFLNGFFKNRGPGFFIDVGAFDGILGSNTFYFEDRLQWTGIAFEPNPSAFDVLRATRSCRFDPRLRLHQDGQITFLALSEREHHHDTQSRPPGSLLQMMLDSGHGGATAERNTCTHGPR